MTWTDWSASRRLLLVLVVMLLFSASCGGDAGQAGREGTASQRLPDGFMAQHSYSPLVSESEPEQIEADILAVCSFLKGAPDSAGQLLEEINRVGAKRANEVGQPYGEREMSDFAGIVGPALESLCPEEATYANRLLADMAAVGDQLSDDDLRGELAVAMEPLTRWTRWSNFPNEDVTLELLKKWFGEACGILDSTAADEEAVYDYLEEQIPDEVPDISDDELIAMQGGILGLGMALYCPEHLQAVGG